MNNKIIIIEGYLASGKSTFALQLSKSINVPYLIKDTFKIALCKNISVTFDAMMYVTERLFETGNPVIIEGNFVPGGIKKTDEAKIIRQLIGKYDYTPLTFKFTGDTQALHKRFIDREKTIERGQVNKIGFDISHDTFDRWCHNLDDFNVGGKVIPVDATDFTSVNFDAYIEYVRQFMS